MKKLLVLGLLLSSVSAHASHSEVEINKHYEELYSEDREKIGYECKICHEIFWIGGFSKANSALQALKRHYLDKHKEKKLKCFQCSKLFSSRNVLRSHERYHEKSKELEKREKEKEDDPFAAWE